VFLVRKLISIEIYFDSSIYIFYSVKTMFFFAKSNQIKSNQIKSNQIKSNQIKSNQIKSIKSINIFYIFH